MSRGAIIWIKLICHLVIGVFGPWAASLAQWINSGEWPSRIVWLGVILPASAIGGAGAVLAFISSSFSDYQRAMNGLPKAEPGAKPPTA